MIAKIAKRRMIAGGAAGVAILSAVVVYVVSIKDDDLSALPIAEATTLVDQAGTIRIFADLRQPRDSGCGVTKNLALKVTEKHDRIVLRLTRPLLREKQGFLVSCEQRSSPGITLRAPVGARPVVDASDGSAVSVTQVDVPIDVPTDS